MATARRTRSLACIASVPLLLLLLLLAACPGTTTRFVRSPSSSTTLLSPLPLSDDDVAAPEPCVCVPLETDGRPYSTWVAWYFHDCVYTPTERWAFFLGISTIGFWVVAQFPQMAESYRLKRVEGVSLGLLLQWLFGDGMNLLGCVLAGQLKTQLLTALYFCMSDVLLVSQYSYYRFFYAGPPSPSAPKIHNEEVVIDTWSPSAAEAAGTEDNRERQPLLSPASNHASTSSECVSSGAAAGGETIHPLCSSSPCGPQLRVPAPAATRFAVLGTILALVAAIVALMIWYCSQDSPEDHRGGEPVICNAKADLTPVQELIGTLSAWGSATLYLLSRIPQLLQNYRRKSVHGLSILMFGLAIAANVTYGAGILLRFPAIDSKFWKDTFPYLMGSLGTLAFDSAIMAQARIYGTDPPPDEDEG